MRFFRTLKRNIYTLWYYFKPLFIAAVIVVFLFFVLKIPMLIVGLFNSFDIVNLFRLLAFAFFVLYLARKILLFSGVVACIRRSTSHIDDIINNRVFVLEGKPRVGKTLTMTNDAIELADYNADRLYSEFFFLQAKQEYDGKLSEDEAREYAQLIKSVKYIDDYPDKYPLLWSNYRIQVGDMTSNDLEYSHFVSRDVLPEKAVLVEDESADDFANDKFKYKEMRDEKHKLDKFFSKVGHYGDFYLLNTEQDKSELHIGLRRVVGINRYLYSRAELFRPTRLINKLERIRRRGIKHGGYTCRQYALVKKLHKQIDRIGFFEFEYVDYMSTEKQGGAVEKGSYILPLNFPFKYESRAYRWEYSPECDEVKYSPARSLYREFDEGRVQPFKSFYDFFTGASQTK